MIKQKINALVGLVEDVKVYGKVLLEAETKAQHAVEQIKHPATYTEGFTVGYEEGLHECMNCFENVLNNLNERLKGDENEKDVVH